MWGYLIVFIILYFLLRPVIKLLWGVHRARKQFNDIFKEQHGFSSGRDDHDTQEAHVDPHTGRRKVYASDDGEYVDFEEVQSPLQQPASSPVAETNRPYEPQVTDAEFEDLN